MGNDSLRGEKDYLDEANMKITLSGNTVVVHLSRRNLNDLIDSLNEKNTEGLVRQDGSVRLTVIPQEDKDHYKGRTPGPGYWKKGL